MRKKQVGKKQVKKPTSPEVAYKMPDCHQILSEHIDQILGKSCAILTPANAVDESSIELELKRELEDPDTNCIHFYDVNQSHFIQEQPTNLPITADPLLSKIKTEQEGNLQWGSEYWTSPVFEL